MTRPTRLARRTIAVAVLAGLVLVGVILIRQQSTLNDLTAEHERLQAQLTDLQYETFLDQFYAADADSPENLRRAARERLGYCLPGEIVFTKDGQTP